VIIMTSNVGASELQRNRYVGFNVGDGDQEHEDMKSKVMDELKKAFRPEFLNRIDETIVFHSLEKKHMREIVVLMIEQLVDRLKDQEIEFSLTDKAIDKVVEEGFDPEYGARPLRRSIQKNIEDLLSAALLREDIRKGEKVKVGLNSQGDFIVLG